MSERPFHCIPGELWLDDEALDAVSDDAEFLFRKFADASDRDWRIRVSREVDPMAHAHSLRARLFRGMTKNQRWPRARIDSALRELRARGLLHLNVHGTGAEERHWLELAPRLQYTKGEDRGRMPGAAVQGEMGLQQGLALLPEPLVERPAVAQGRIPLRRVKKKSRADDSGPGTRALARVGESSGGAPRAFPRWIEDRPGDEVWKGLCLLLGESEMAQNGDMWMRRMEIRCDMIGSLLAEVTRQGTDGVDNVGAWFNSIFEERRKLWA